MDLSVTNGKIHLGVVIHGKEIPEFVGPDGLTHIEGRPGSPYNIQLANFTSGRVECVLTVDGIDVLTGVTGNHTTCRGYVIDAHTKPNTIPGFKLAPGSGAAQFTFIDPAKSYAAQTDRPANVGVIGVAFFRERDSFPSFTPYIVRRSNLLGGDSFRGESPMFGGMKGSTMGDDPSLGTSFGKQVAFETGKTTFDRATSEPFAVLVLYYDTAEALLKKGIDVRRPKPQVAVPSPFPGNQEGCTPPPGWKPSGGSTSLR